MALSTSTTFLLRSPLLRRPPAPAPVAAPPLRLVAAFCPTRDEALRLHAELSGHLHLVPDQALVLAPAELGTPRLADCLQRWRALRQAIAQPEPAATTLPGLLARLGRVLLAGVGAANGAAVRPTRFDRTVEWRLAQGLHAVVVQQPRGAYSCNYLLANLRDAGLAWCAEAPHRRAGGPRSRAGAQPAAQPAAQPIAAWR